MKLKELCAYLDYAVPLSFQESYDNSGLQVGLPESEISCAILTLDVTEEIVEEAISGKCDVIISHHPVIFNGIKSLSGKSYTERIVYKAIKNNIAIYSAHTNLDIFQDGVSRKMSRMLNLSEVKVLSPSMHKVMKLVTFIPESYLEKVRDALFEAGAGVTGKYDNCGFSASGTGSFRGNKDTKPFVGKKGQIHFEKEIRFETVLFSHLKNKVIKRLLEVHPYEEVAYDLYSLENASNELGLGCVGLLEKPVKEDYFIKHVSEVFNAMGLRSSLPLDKDIRKVALCGGSGISLLQEAKAIGADAFITSDIKYHNFFDADNMILLLDIGHYESEIFSTEILYDLIIKKFPKFAVRFSETKTNPINYF